MESRKASELVKHLLLRDQPLPVVYQKCRVAFKIETKPSYSEQSMIRIGQYIKQVSEAVVSFPSY